MFDNKKQKIKDVQTSPKIEHEKVTMNVIQRNIIYAVYVYISNIYHTYIFYLCLLSKYWIICYIY